MDAIWQDIVYGFRSLLRRPGITAIALLTLALGVGANTAIFSVVDTVLLQPLAYKDPGRIVFIAETTQQVPDMSIAMANFDDWKSANHVFEAMAPYQSASVILTGNGDPERLRMRRITAGFFPTLGVQPILGRALTPEDDKVGAAPVVLISDGLWSRKYARNPNVIGQKINLDSELYTIVGVIANARFHGGWRNQSLFSSLWRLEDKMGGPANRDSHPGIYALARLKPGVTIEQAKSDLNGIAARLAEQYPISNTGHGVSVDSVMNSYVGNLRQPLLILMAAVGFVLLIACANVANLMLARATERQKEMSIRVALGASRSRLLRQLLTESLLLGVTGGLLGLAMAWSSIGLLTRLASPSVPRMDDLTINVSVLCFALGISVLTAFLFGVFPAWQASQSDVQDALKEGTRGASANKGRRKFQSALIIAEVAVSMVLLVGAGLAVKSLFRALGADAGFDDRGVLTGTFNLPDRDFQDPAKQVQFVNQFVAKVQAIPGVESAGFEWPLLGGAQDGYMIEGKPAPTPENPTSVDNTVATPDALKAMGVRLERGRFFNDFDSEKAQRVCIVDTMFATKEWPGQDPVGRRVATRGFPEKPEWMTVVGVVSHVMNYGVDQPSRIEIYEPDAQQPRSFGSIIVRTKADPASLVSAVKSAIVEVNPNVPLFDVQPLSDVVDANVASRRLSSVLLGVFAALALVLAAIGIYGVMSYMVTQRSHEIGIRIALGAQRKDVLGIVLGNGMTLLAAGLAIGFAGAFSLSRFMEALLFQVKATDAATFATIPIVLAMVALAACYIPARRAMRVDPIIALREE